MTAPFTDLIQPDALIPPGTPPPKISAEVWTRGDGIEYPPEQVDVLEIADVVRINDTWHVVVVVDE